MQISAVSGVIQFLRTFVADCNVRRNINLTVCLLTDHDPEIIIHSRLFQRLLIYFQNRCSFGRLFLQQGAETADPAGITLCNDLHVRSLVAHAAADPCDSSMSVHCRAETDTLHDPVYTKTHRHPVRHSRDPFF